MAHRHAGTQNEIAAGGAHYIAAQGASRCFSSSLHETCTHGTLQHQHTALNATKLSRKATAGFPVNFEYTWVIVSSTRSHWHPHSHSSAAVFLCVLVSAASCASVRYACCGRESLWGWLLAGVDGNGASPIGAGRLGGTCICASRTRLGQYPLQPRRHVGHV